MSSGYTGKKSATFCMRMEPQKKKQMEEFFQKLGLTRTLVPVTVKRSLRR